MTISKLLRLLLLALTFPGLHLFTPVRNGLGLPRSRYVLNADFEYEYIPKENDFIFQTDLESSYPPGTPAGLRGEAIRAALKSGRCLAWNFDGTKLQQGILSVEGEGFLNFLNSKLTQSFDKPSETEGCLSKSACLLNGKGRLVDVLDVVLSDDRAYLITSPGHQADSLFAKLDPFIFPMDKVNLQNLSQDAVLFSLASTKKEDLVKAFDRQILPQLNIQSSKGNIEKGCQMIELSGGGVLLVTASSMLPSCAAHGLTFYFVGCQSQGESVWNYLVAENNVEGPIQTGPLEYESLRIEMGVPAFGNEITGNEKNPPETPASPLELHMEPLIETDKGCYLGQEGIASMLKNQRGPPRCLYQIVFEDEFNLYEHQTEGDKDENLTRLPKAGDRLFVLGSNGEIDVGALTSVAEPSGNGKPYTVGLALIKRPDSILKRMREMDIYFSTAPVSNVSTDGSGLVMPPPMDPLHGLEVILEKSFTVGKLLSVPQRRYEQNANLFEGDTDISIFSSDDSVEDEMASTTWNPDLSSNTLPGWEDAVIEEKVENDAEVSKVEEDVDSEVARKEEKVEALRRKADEALARRKAAKQESPATGSATDGLDDAAEAKRKEAKMEKLRKKAEEAMSRRKAQKSKSS